MKLIQAMRVMGVDLHPPVCGSCKYSEKRNVRQITGKGDDQMQALYCFKGNFLIARGAVCDHWVSKDGRETLT